MSLKKVGLVVAGTAAAGAVVLGGATLADAAAKTSTAGAPGGYSAGHPGGPDHTPVTGDELAKVTAAVEAEDPAATVTGVRKDPDGSYDVFATKSGNPAMYEVSADLKTVTERQGRGGGHRGGGHRDAGTAVTGDELAKVTAAVKAKDSSVTVTDVRKHPDGSYHVFATRNGTPAMYQVSADLKTITERQGPTGGPRPAPRSSTD